MDAHAPDDAVDAPRAQTGPNPQHLLATVLGEYLDSADAAMPSSALVAVLGEFGISAASARAAVSRLVRRGLLTSRGQGRATLVHLTPQAIARHRSTMHAILAFGATPRPADGAWAAVTFSLPQAQQARRHAVRKALGSLGFVRLYDSVWISPDDDVAGAREAMAALLDDVDGARWSVMHVRFDDEAGPHGPASAYDVEGLRAAYAGFVAEHAPLRDEVRRGVVAAARALVARTRLMDSWRRIVLDDPDLPEHLLPRPWPRDEARALMLEVHTALGPPAQARLVEVMTPSWPAAADWVTHYVASSDPTRPPRRARSARGGRKRFGRGADGPIL